jgi:quercetin dioxygenase-like cupin family protein
MPFIEPDELPRVELFPKALSGIAAGEHLMLSFLDLAPGCRIPEHSHPHEQAGLVLEGTLRFRIGDEERVASPGEAFIIPPNVVHEGEVVDGPVRVLDIFSPPREDYVEKYNRYLKTSPTTKWS